MYVPEVMWREFKIRALQAMAQNLTRMLPKVYIPRVVEYHAISVRRIIKEYGSLRTDDVFPVVFERSDDRKYVCGSQARNMDPQASYDGLFPTQNGQMPGWTLKEESTVGI